MMTIDKVKKNYQLGQLSISYADIVGYTESSSKYIFNVPIQQKLQQSWRKLFKMNTLKYCLDWKFVFPIYGEMYKMCNRNRKFRIEECDI